MKNIEKLSEPFFHGDSYHFDFYDFMQNLTPQEIWELQDLEIINCIEKPIVQLDQSALIEMIQNYFQENSSEDGDEWDSLPEKVQEFFPEETLKKFSESMPTLWWPLGEKIIIPKEEVMEFIQSTDHDLNEEQ